MSTKDVLSEGELDALMDSVSSGDVPLDDGSGDYGCQPFDFSTREQALLAQMPALKTINEKHALSLTQSIQALFKIPVVVEPGETRLVKLEETIISIAEPSGINLIQITPLNGVSFVVLSGDLLSFFVNQYFGGGSANSSFKSSRQELTPTERRINDLLTTKFLSDLEAAWLEKIGLKTERVSFETNPDFLQVGSPSELALQFSFSIKVFDWEGSIDWIIPYSSVEPLKPRLGSPALAFKSDQSGVSWENYFRKELLAVALDISGVYTSKNVSIGEVLNLKEGSIVPLKRPTDVTLCIDGRPFCSGEHGVLNGKKSIKIKEIFDSEAGSS
jgi:flagellar motor switch protein FliM